LNPVICVSFIIVNWNGRDLLPSCLESLRAQSCQSFEVIVVDNGSSDDSVRFLHANFPEVNVVELYENRGFAGGNNAGLDHCRGKYIALLNNDAELHSDWLCHMLEAIETGEEVGFCSSRIFVKGGTTIDSVGDRFTTAFTGTKVGEGQDGGLYDSQLELHGICAASALYKKKMIEDVGFFDDDFFLNYEDTDLNIRAWLRGWKCLYVPDAKVYHAVNSTIGRMSSTSVYFFSRNTFLSLVKNFPLRLILRQIPQRLFYEICAFIYYAILNKRFFSYVRGKFDAIVLLPRFIGKRKDNVPFVRLSDSEIMAELLPITSLFYQKFKDGF